MSALFWPIRKLMSLMHGPVYESRKRALTARILMHLKAGDRVLDVGCGWGALGRAIMDDKGCPDGVVVEGLERVQRGGEAIEVRAYEGGRMPLDDGVYDVVIVADVLHHEPNPDELLAECARVAKRLVIIKDHQRQGILAKARISLIDWAANAPYGVPCLYRYNTRAEWEQIRTSHGLGVVEELSGMKLYPPVVEQLFGGRLQYFAALETRDSDKAVEAA